MKFARVDSAGAPARPKVTGESRGRVLALLVAALFAGAWGATAAQIILPAGFVESRITGFVSPTVMAAAPDGRLFVCEHAGAVRVVKNGVRLGPAFCFVSLHQFGERGLVGVQVDPNFAQNNFLYIYYPAKTPTIHFRLSRFTANGDVAVPGSEVALFDLPTLGPSDWHNGGGIQFGPDGKLFLSVGENNQPQFAQSLTSVLGKILRINPDGSIPTDNPFFNSTTGNNRAIYALGMRNPFTLAIQPGTGRLFANDVGQGAWEEIDEIVAGGNYGWPITEGAAHNPNFRDPFYAFPHPTVVPRSSAITGGAFYNPAHPNFPAQYLGKYFFVDGEQQNFGVLDTATRTATTFATIPYVNGIASELPLCLTVSPDGSLNYVARQSREVHVIRFVGAQAPQIGTSPTSILVSVGDPAAFTVEAFGSAPLNFQWQRRTPPAVGFTDIPGATSTSFQLAQAALADNNSQFRCVVQNGAGTTTSAVATLTVSGNHPPVAIIVAPAAGMTFRAGDTFEFNGRGTDFEDGELTADRFTWRVDFQHLEHSHPFVPDTTGVTNGFFATQIGGETSDQIWYRIFLTVTDSNGKSNSTFRDVLPIRSTFSLATVPPGLSLDLDQSPVATPLTVPAVVNLQRELTAPNQVVAGIPYQFVSWSDGLAQNHLINSPETPTPYTATFQPVFTAGDHAGFVTQTNPSTVFVGQTSRISVVLVNIGSTTWRAADNYFLSAINPPDTLTWGLNRVTLPADVAPGQAATFTFDLVAPLTPGTYDLQWQMIHEGAALFGQATPNARVLVLTIGTRGNAAAFVSQTVPTLMAPGTTATATITLRNTGSNTWSEAQHYRLASINPQDNGTWNLRRVFLPNPIPPGALCTFTFPIRAPLTPGNYNFQWTMIQELIERFQQVTPNVVIQVSNAAPIPPQFTVQPLGKTVVVGQTATFTAAASASPSATLQWQRQGPGDVVFLELPGATAGTFTTPILTLADSGAQFRCVANNPAGNATSAVATLTVVGIAPAFTLQPLNATIVQGQTANFIVAASGVPVPTLQWQYRLPGTVGFLDIPGANAATYPTPLLGLPDTGTQFRCVATNGFGDAASVTVTVTVTSGTPVFTTQPTNSSVVQAQTASFTAAAAGFPTPALQWQIQAPSTLGFIDIPGATAGTYTTPILALADTGTQFRCVATNTAGDAASASATLTVTSGSPAFTTQPANKSVAPGQTASFTAAAFGIPAPTLQWQIQAPATVGFIDIPGANAGTFTTPILALADSGTQFRCVATNALGDAASAAATLSVPTVSPTFTTQPVNKSVTPGQTATFTAAASGIPAPNLQWQIQAPATVGFIDLPGANTGTFTTPPLALADSGAQFRCVATNLAGNAASSVATLTVTAGGTAPTVTRFFPSDTTRNVPLATQPTVTFSQAMDPATLTPATITVRRTDQATNLLVTVTYDGPSLTATVHPVTPLKTDWKYIVTVLGGAAGAKSQAGVALAATASSAFYSKDTQPPRFSLIAVSGVTRTTANIVWDTNEIADSQVRFGFTTLYGQTSPLDPAQIRQHAVTLTGLTPGKTYNFQVRGTDEFGNAGNSGNFTFSTPP